MIALVSSRQLELNVKPGVVERVPIHQNDNTTELAAEILARHQISGGVQAVATHFDQLIATRAQRTPA